MRAYRTTQKKLRFHKQKALQEAECATARSVELKTAKARKKRARMLRRRARIQRRHLKFTAMSTTPPPPRSTPPSVASIDDAVPVVEHVSGSDVHADSGTGDMVRLFFTGPGGSAAHSRPSSLASGASSDPPSTPSTKPRGPGVLRSLSQKLLTRNSKADSSLARAASEAAAASHASLRAAFGLLDENSDDTEGPVVAEGDNEGPGEEEPCPVPRKTAQESPAASSGVAQHSAVFPRHGFRTKLRNWWQRLRQKPPPKKTERVPASVGPINSIDSDVSDPPVEPPLRNRGHWMQVMLPSGDMVFVHSLTGEARKSPPLWIDVVDASTGRLRFVNTRTKKQRDSAPAQFIPIVWKDRGAALARLSL